MNLESPMVRIDAGCQRSHSTGIFIWSVHKISKCTETEMRLVLAWSWGVTGSYTGVY